MQLSSQEKEKYTIDKERVVKLAKLVSSPMSDLDRTEAMSIIEDYGIHYGHAGRTRKVDTQCLKGSYGGLDMFRTEIVLDSIISFHKIISEIIHTNKLIFYIYNSPVAEQLEKLLSSYHLFAISCKWVGGTLTNTAFSSLYYIKRYNIRLGFIPEYVINLSNSYTDLLLRECKKMEIRSISVIDTNNKQIADYPLMINDDSYYSHILIVEILKNILENKAKA